MLISDYRRWYEVRDPAEVGHRVEATIGDPAILCELPVAVKLNRSSQSGRSKAIMRKKGRR
jgi:hypothetical protein